MPGRGSQAERRKTARLLGGMSKVIGWGRHGQCGRVGGVWRLTASSMAGRENGAVMSVLGTRLAGGSEATNSRPAGPESLGRLSFILVAMVPVCIVPAWGEHPHSSEEVVRGRTTYEEGSLKRLRASLRTSPPPRPSNTIPSSHRSGVRPAGDLHGRGGRNPVQWRPVARGGPGLPNAAVCVWGRAHRCEMLHLGTEFVPVWRA